MSDEMKFMYHTALDLAMLDTFSPEIVTKRLHSIIEETTKPLQEAGDCCYRTAGGVIKDINKNSEKEYLTYIEVQKRYNFPLLDPDAFYRVQQVPPDSLTLQEKLQIVQEEINKLSCLLEKEPENLKDDSEERKENFRQALVKEGVKDVDYYYNLSVGKLTKLNEKHSDLQHQLHICRSIKFDLEKEIMKQKLGI